MGPLVASWVHKNLRWRTSFASRHFVFSRCSSGFCFFSRNRARKRGTRPLPAADTLGNFWKVLTNPKFMLFLLIFSGFWIVYWQEFITLPIYVHDYISSKADTERMLATGPAIVIALTVAMSVATQKMAAFRAVILGTFIAMIAFRDSCRTSHRRSSLRPRSSLSRLANLRNSRATTITFRAWPRPANKARTWALHFCRWGIGAFLAGRIGGALLHYFGEVRHQPQLFLWALTANRRSHNLAVAALRPHGKTKPGAGIMMNASAHEQRQFEGIFTET